MTLSSAAPVQAKTYLNLCREQLHPSTVKEFEKVASRLDAKAKVFLAGFAALPTGFVIVA
jgi:hypothetical protein